MKKMLAILLSAVMVLALLAGCGSKDNDKNKDSDTQGGDASALNVAVFYYDFSDVYISSVRNSMEEQFNAMGIKPSNYDGAGNQAQQTDQINTAISNGANLLIVNIVETSSPDAAQNAVEAAKTAGIPIIFFNREVSDDVVKSYDKCAFVGTDAPEAGHMQGKLVGEYLFFFTALRSMVWKNMRNACGRPGASIFIMSISRSFAKPTPSTVCRIWNA